MSNLYKIIGNRIKKLRKIYGSKGLSQEELAKKIQVPTNNISRWETATYKISAADLQKLARFFQEDISFFFPETEQTKLKPNLQALMSATSDLNDDDIAELTEYARFRKARQILNENRKRKSK